MSYHEAFIYLFNLSAHKQKKESLVSLYRLVLTPRYGPSQTASSLPRLLGNIILCNAKMEAERVQLKLSKTSMTHVMSTTLASLTLFLYGGNSRVILLLGAVGIDCSNCILVG